MLLCVQVPFTALAEDKAEKVFTHDGLEQVIVEDHKVVYKKPGVDFSEYDKLLIMKAQVAFRKNWQKNYNRDNRSTGLKVTDADALKIKEKVAELFDEVFIEEFTTHKYQLVTEPQSGTLIIRPALVNLDVTAPTTSSAVMSKVYTKDTGSVTLFLEFYDGVSGEILARVGEGKIIGDRGYFNWANRARNYSDGKRLLQGWAVKLREYLDGVIIPKTEKSAD